MLSSLLRSLAALALLVVAAAAQAPTRDDFRAGFTKGFDYGDEKIMDSWLKKQECAGFALLYFEELYREKSSGVADNTKKCEALKAAWARCFEGSRTLDKVQRWADGVDQRTYDTLERSRLQATRVWNNHINMPQPKRDELLLALKNFVQLAETAKSLGQMTEAAEMYLLAAVVGSKIDKADQVLDDRRQVVLVSEEFLGARDAWEFTFDSHYLRAKAFVKDEKLRIEEDAKKADKRKAEGYEDDVKGIETLVMPNVAEEKVALEYRPLKEWEKELDYGPKNGPAPVLWWNATTAGDDSANKIAWFQRRDIFLARLGGAKFGIALEAKDLSKAVPIHVAGKPKPSTFWLDDAKTIPYTMWFWCGSDREFIGLAECNLSFTNEFALVYYRSAASWAGKVGKDTITFYDDNANGRPCDGDPWAMEFKAKTVGEHEEKEGTPVPLLDSMRVGKGPRVPYSEFVALEDGWYHMTRTKTKDDEVGRRPLNPEYFKLGKVKLAWSGLKSSLPVQLVIQGQGVTKGAFFDVAGGKEVDVPVGEYRVIFGRVVAGKGARIQNATLYGGESQPFRVEEGRLTELKMGAPFQVQWTRKGDQNATIDALKVMVRESSGCYLTELHGAPLAPEVMISKTEDGKGARPEGGKFVPFTDAELVTTAGNTHQGLSTLTALFPQPQGYTKGALTLTLHLPAEGMKLALVQKKHPLFGELLPLWQ